MRRFKVGWWRAARDTRSLRVMAACALATWAAACQPVSVAADEATATRAEQPAAPAADVAAIRAAASAYRDALSKGDAATIQKAWAANGDIIDGWGNLLSIADVTAGGDKPGPGARPEFRVAETRLRFLTPDVAIEDGSVDVTLPGTKTPLEGWFSAIWVRDGGAWKLAGIREAERPTAPGPDTLDDLDWMVGDWKLVTEGEPGKDAAPAMEMTVRWDAGRMFLVRDMRLRSATGDAEPATLDVHQRIGWDPLVGRVRAWSFASDGTRGEATWFRDGSSWVAKGTAILPDGTQKTTVQIYSFDGQDRCRWRALQEPLAVDEDFPARATWVRQRKGETR